MKLLKFLKSVLIVAIEAAVVLCINVAFRHYGLL